MTSYYEEIIEQMLTVMGPGELGQAVDLLCTKHEVSKPEAFELLVGGSSLLSRPMVESGEEGPAVGTPNAPPELGPEIAKGLPDDME